ncbi:tyrosine-type recombinase/integrase, partial [Sulfurovum sp. zt1-1]
PKYTETDDILPFTMEEVITLIDNAAGFFKSYITVAFFTGMRSGELIALKWDDIDFNSNKIIVRRNISEGIEGTTKTGKARTIDMLDSVREALVKQYTKTGLSSEYVFSS